MIFKSKWFYLVVLLSMLIISAVAQEVPDPTAPNTSEFSFEDLPPEIQLDIKATMKEMEERSIFHIRVAYLYGEGQIAEGDILDPKSFQPLTGAILITSQEQLLSEWASEPFDGIFVHASALTWLDTTWTREAYRHEVITFGFNLQHSQMRDVTGDECTYQENHKVLFPEDSHFVLDYTYHITVSDPSIIEEVNRSQLELCENYKGSGGAEVDRGVFQYEFRTQAELDWILSVMPGESVNYGKPRRYEEVQNFGEVKP